MSYKKSKDRILKVWRIIITNAQTAVVSLKSYDGGKPRLQIGPVEIEKPNCELIHSRIKRWGWDELHDLRDAIDQALELMDELAVKRKKKA